MHSRADVMASQSPLSRRKAYRHQERSQSYSSDHSLELKCIQPHSGFKASSRKGNWEDIPETNLKFISEFLRIQHIPGRGSISLLRVDKLGLVLMITK